MIGHWNSEEEEALQYLPLRAQVIYLRGIRRFADANGIAGLKRSISWKSLSEVAEVRPRWGSKNPLEIPTRKEVRVSLEQLEAAGLIKRLPQSKRFEGLVFKCLKAVLDQSVQKRKGQGRAMIQGPEEGPQENREDMRPSEEGRAKGRAMEKPSKSAEEGPASPSPSELDISNDISLSERAHTPKRKSSKSSQGTRLPDDWVLPDELRNWAEPERPDLDIDRVAEIFKDYWLGQPGKDGRKADWKATWRNWVRREKAPTGGNDTRQGHVQQHSKGNLTHDDFNSKDYQSDATRDEDLPEWLRNALH